ncbi:MAG TPA: cytochrome c [Planctomycetota bacterium]|nr:cytochrome c [Planctomycetota bacterium]
MSQNFRWIVRAAPWICLVASCASDAKPTPPSEPANIAAPVAVKPPTPIASPEQDEDAVTGKSLYQRHCAGCHNDNGDGRGATMLQQGKQARSFAQGGFAFGNTVEQISKTIASGIPGSSLMQSFKSVMDADEMKLVAEYVLTLTPYKEATKAADSVLVVGDRAVFAYGKLPPLHEGGLEFPRGLMVGLPGGLSFEYRVDDVRLLAVRRGGFVDREDWNERGGGFLKPIGDLVFEVRGGDPRPWMFSEAGPAVEFDLKAARTSGKDGRDVELELTPKKNSAPGLRRVTETLFQSSVSAGPCFGRRLVFDQDPGAPVLRLMPIDCLEGGMAIFNTLGGPAEVAVHPAKGKDYDNGRTCWIIEHGVHGSGGFDCVYLKTNFNPSIGGDPTSLSYLLLNRNRPKSGPAELTIVTVHVEQWDEALLDRLTQELAR